MLLYDSKTFGYIKYRILPNLLLAPKKYRITGSFARETPYITDIDVNNVVHPKINKTNIHSKILDLFKKFGGKICEDIFIVAMRCGEDERFFFTDNFDKDIERFKTLLSDEQIKDIDNITSKNKNNTEKNKWEINNYLKKIRNIYWYTDEVLSDEKILPGNVIVNLSTLLNINTHVIVHAYARIKICPIDFDLNIIYDKSYYTDTFKTDISERLVAQKNEFFNTDNYFDKLFFIRNRMRAIKNENYTKIEDHMEKKYGLYKQLLHRIKNYFSLKKINMLCDNYAIGIIHYILYAVKYLPEFNSNIPDLMINKLKKKYNVDQLLKNLYDEIYETIGRLSKDIYFEFVNKIDI